jgi:glycosyltransferase involved in cell wall biosynthesis
MLYLAVPTGAFHGWGVCGRQLVKELSALTEISLLTDPFDLGAVGDELDYHLLKSALVQVEPCSPVSHPVLQAITNTQLLPYRLRLRGSFNLGYVFFENNLLAARYAGNLRQRFDFVAAGSHFCEEVLRSGGLTGVGTVLQGVDPALFNPAHSEKEYFREVFVVFSGGKFEFRKGQDLVIRAFKALQDKYRDVLLVNSWFNGWPSSINTMQVSRHISFRPAPSGCLETLNQTLDENGLDRNRVITLLPRPNLMMARIYKNTDVGLFPNRCEGGTNLVLMEYMACGKPAIASLNSGHKDILTIENSIPIRTARPITIREGETDIALWEEPDLDETIAHLEWAYLHRDRLGPIGARAGQDMTQCGWKRTASQLDQILKAGGVRSDGV